MRLIATVLALPLCFAACGEPIEDTDTQTHELKSKTGKKYKEISSEEANKLLAQPDKHDDPDKDPSTWGYQGGCSLDGINHWWRCKYCFDHNNHPLIANQCFSWGCTDCRDGCTEPDGTPLCSTDPL